MGKMKWREGVKKVDEIRGYYSLKIGEKTKEEGEITCNLFRSLEEARKHMDSLLSEEG